MFKDYDIKEMKIEEMGLVNGLSTIDESIENIKKTMSETGENFKNTLEEFNRYKEKFGGDCLCGWCDDNDMGFIGYIFVKENKIIGIVPYM